MTERLKSPLHGILKPKDIYNPYLLAGVAGRLAVNLELGAKPAITLDAIMARFALDNSIARPQSQAEVPAGGLWHGTGRYKYKNGKVLDVLSSIADTGAILPHLDKFDLNRQMNSVSLAKSRVYARSYADMHGKGHYESERFGSSMMWACAFLGSVAVEASKEVGVLKPKGYYKMLDHLSEARASEWYKSVTMANNPGVIEVYKRGSDIADNYPVVFHVRDVEPAAVSRAVALHEVRTEQPIRLDENVSHVEVPRDKIDETERILGGVAIRAIEDGEYYSSQFSFTQHMQGLAA